MHEEVEKTGIWGHEVSTDELGPYIQFWNPHRNVRENLSKLDEKNYWISDESWETRLIHSWIFFDCVNEIVENFCYSIISDFTISKMTMSAATLQVNSLLFSLISYIKSEDWKKSLNPKQGFSWEVRVSWHDLWKFMSYGISSEKS